MAAVDVVQVLGLKFVAAARADARLEVEPLKSLRSSCNKARAPFKTSDCAAASAEAFVGTWLQRLSCRRRACCVLSHEAFVLSLSRVRATQAATNGARARAHLLIVAVAARSLSYRRVRLDLASVAEWLDRFAVPFLKRAQRAPHAATNRARVRAHLLMVAVAAQHVSVRVHFFRLTPAPPVRRLELALTRGALVTGGTARNFRFTLPAVSSPAR